MMMKPTTDLGNVWQNIHRASSRRIKSDGRYNFFWICDGKGHYGLLISICQRLDDKDFSEKIKGITIAKDSQRNDGDDLYLIVNDNNDWQIFYHLCLDLLDVSEKCSSETILIKSLKTRLKRWRFFLSEGNSFTMSEIRQMGLFAELLCLKDILIPNLGVDNALAAWVGPDLDRQDFSLNAFLLEVKSFLSSKGAFVKISSLHQLINDIKPLYLIAYGISRQPTGHSIEDIAQSIFPILDNGTEELFGQKLAEYGYVEGITEEPFYKYHADNIRCYAVTDDFPKILPGQVKEQIVAAQYTLDLARCSKFEIELNSIFR